MASTTGLPETISPTILRFKAEGSELLRTAEAIEITCEADLEAAAAVAVRFARVKQSIRDFFMASLSAAEETKRQAEKTRKAIQTNIETLIAPVDRADVNLRAKLSLYQMERQRIAAKKRADDEAEARKQADEQKLADAVRLENLAKATGDTVYQQQAEQVLEAPVSIEVHAKAAPPKLEGVSFVDEVGVVVDDWSKLLWSVARGEVKPHAKTMEKVREALTSWLVVEAKQQGDAFAVPGVTRTVRQVPRVRA